MRPNMYDKSLLAETRRGFLQFVATTTALGAVRGNALAVANQQNPNLAGEVGITTGSFVRHLTESPQAGKLRLLDLPRIMRDDLDMKVIDLMTATLASLEPTYLEK